MTKKEVCEKFASQWSVDAIRLRRRLTDWIRAKKTEKGDGQSTITEVVTEVDADFDFTTSQKAEFMASYFQEWFDIVK